MARPLISIIIPIFNGAKTISRCLDSIYNLSIAEGELEVVVIDDCSTDNTMEVLSSYSEIHSNLLVIKQSKNHRQGAARNRGFQISHGAYVSFLDRDDVILPGFLSAIEIAKDSDADLVYCSTIHEKTEIEAIEVGISLPQNEIMSGCDFCEKYYDKGVFWYPWGYLIKRSFLLQLNYPFVEDRQCEDRDWMAYVLSCANSVVNSKKPMYKYIYNPDSTCRAVNYSMVFDHTASGIRHIDLSSFLENKCPNLSKTLRLFGIDEIYRNLRLRNLSKFSLLEINKLYDKCHLKPLLPKLRELQNTVGFPFSIHLVIRHPVIEMLLLVISIPIAHVGRRIIHIFH